LVLKTPSAMPCSVRTPKRGVDRSLKSTTRVAHRSCSPAFERQTVSSDRCDSVLS
jgi:hypothetical protein